MAALKHLPEMDSKEFNRWQSLLEKRTGVWLTENRKSFLITSLAQRMRERGFSDYDSYFRSLESGVSSAVEWASLVDLLTVHETRFFRDQASLQLVQSHVQKLIDKSSLQADSTPVDVQIWSVGCSTGEESYSLALLMSELNSAALMSQNRNFYFGITGIDISFPALAQAREGIFHRRQLSSIPINWIEKYFNQLPDDYLQVNDKIRRRICFVQGNVLELNRAPRQLYDIIYCQNLLIYFQNERRQEIVMQFVERLAPGGLLVLGPGELNYLSHSLIEKVSTKHCQAYVRAGS